MHSESWWSIQDSNCDFFPNHYRKSIRVDLWSGNRPLNIQKQVRTFVYHWILNVIKQHLRLNPHGTRFVIRYTSSVLVQTDTPNLWWTLFTAGNSFLAAELLSRRPTMGSEYRNDRIHWKCWFEMHVHIIYNQHQATWLVTIKSQCLLWWRITYSLSIDGEPRYDILTKKV